MKTTRTYNPCDECSYSYSRTGEESSVCKICELTYFINIKPKSGKWENVDIGRFYRQYKCTVCKKQSPSRFDFCPNCGAQMVERK